MFGRAPWLPSDTPMERVLKKWPVWARPLVKEAVDGDWIGSLQMVVEREEWMARRREQDGTDDTLGEHVSWDEELRRGRATGPGFSN